jgi:drug/metabolite transporter (DMT)-like permease
MLQKILKNPFGVGLAAIVVAAFLWSLDGLFFRTQLYGLPAEVVVFWEHALGFVVLSPFLIHGFSKLRYLSKKDWLSVLWISIVGSLIGTLFITKAFFAAYTLGLSITIVVILQKLQPITALFLARLMLKEKLARTFYGWAVLAIVSAYFLAFGLDGFHLPSKDFLTDPAWYAIVAAIAFGSSTVFGKRLVYHLDFKSAAALRFGLGSVFALIYLSFATGFGAVSEVSPVEWKYIFIIVCSTGTLALFIYYFGLKRVSASVATLAELFFPLFTILLEFIFFGKFLTPAQLIFAIIFIAAVYMATKSKEAPYQFTSPTERGMRRGARMGIRTINLAREELEVDFGVYLVDITIDGTVYRGLLHYGPVLTFNENVRTELYVRETVPEAETAEVSVSVGRKLRDMKKFDSTEALVEQIREDITALD